MLALVYFPWEGRGLQYRRSCLSALRTSETHRGGTGGESREGSQRRVEVADPPEPSEPSASRAHPSGKTLPERMIHTLLVGTGLLSVAGEAHVQCQGARLLVGPRRG